MTAPTHCPPFGLCVPVEWVETRDGDTHVVRLRKSNYEWAIRLADCWCPETRGGTALQKKIGEKAKIYAEQLLVGADDDIRLYVAPPVNFEVDGFNPLKMFTFDRVPGYLYVGPSQTLNRMLVNAGLASTTKGGELGR